MAANARRVVTVLFADLVGFTSLSERLDPEDVAVIQDEYFGAARQAVESRSGHVEKFIGDAVVGTFGVHRAGEEDSAHAVAAGQAIIEALGGIEAALGLEPGSLQVRVGVNTGEVVVTRARGQAEGWRVTGDAVNVAARLQAAAEPGTVLIGPDTALAAAHAFSIEPVGSIDLKGKALPVASWRVLGRRAVPDRAAALHGLQTPTIGRERELDLLERTVVAAREAVRGVLLVAPPGVGKSRLAGDFAERVRAAGGTVWMAKAFPAITARYEVAAQLVRDALGHLPPGQAGRDLLLERLERIGHTGPRAVLSADHTVALVTGVQLDAGPYDLWTSWTAVLDASGDDSPPVWLIEDVHLAGPDQLAFLRHAVAEPHRRDRMVLATARPAMVGPRPEAWPPGVEVVYLEPLRKSDVFRLVESLVGPGVLPGPVAEAAATASGGNPLFVEEVLRSWVQSGVLRPSASGGWEVTGPLERLDVPSTIRAVYLGQLDDLPEVPRRVVEAGSVAGITFPSRALPVLGVEQPDPALDLLLRLGLLAGPHDDEVDPFSYTYRHSLLRDAAYGVLPRSSRAQLHVRFAEWVAASLRLETHAEIVGEHLAMAFDQAPALGAALEGLTRDELRRRAADWLERAAQQSLGSAPQRAVQLIERALVLTSDDEPKMGRRRLALAEGLRRSGRLEDAMGEFWGAGELAQRWGDGPLAVAAALGYEDSLFESRLARSEWGPRGLRLLSCALEQPDLDDSARSRLLAARGRAEVYGGAEEHGSATSHLAVETAHRSGDAGALAYALLSLRASQSAPDQLHARLDRTEELIEAARRAGDHESELEGVRLQLVDLLEAGDVGRARACQERAEALIAELRRPLFLWYPAMWRAMTALFAGDLTAADALVEEFRDDGQRWHYGDVERVHTVQRLQLHLELGTPETWLGEAHPVAAESPERFAPALAVGLARAGRLDEAAAQLAVHARHDFTSLPSDLSLAYCLALSVDTAALLGDAAASACLHAALEPWDGHNIVLGSGAIALGAASHFLGLAARTAGDVGGAVVHLRDAVRMNDAMGAAPAATRSRLELARSLLQAGTGGEDEATRLARMALGVARSIGMAQVADELSRLLDRGTQP